MYLGDLDFGFSSYLEPLGRLLEAMVVLAS